ncbi:hypothetical protein [Polyangium sp. 15x6]|uniref:hypothetical protein n=1 Tax=Polyangium sp. 15x6 TaxID=3042687 RepID=UPI00249B96DA|nr:hypothetical protein [Polyangium sp. 15x6]MDI3283810.1 hypothetical protein [Polyangium sp. 15x6]
MAFAIPLALAAAGCGSDVEEDPFADCEGRAYTATIVDPTDGATDVPTDVHVRIQWSGGIPDRYTSMLRVGGEFLSPESSGLDEGGDYDIYPFAPGHSYTFEVGWICVLDGGEKSKSYVLDSAAFTTAAP